MPRQPIPHPVVNRPGTVAMGNALGITGTSLRTVVRDADRRTLTSREKQHGTVLQETYPQSSFPVPHMVGTILPYPMDNRPVGNGQQRCDQAFQLGRERQPDFE